VDIDHFIVTHVSLFEIILQQITEIINTDIILFNIPPPKTKKINNNKNKTINMVQKAYY